MSVKLHDRRSEGLGFYARFYIEGKRVSRALGTKDPAEANRLREALEVRFDSQAAWEAGHAADLPLSVAFRGWLASTEGVHSMRTTNTNRFAAARLVAVLGDVSLRDIGDAHAQRFASEGLKRWAPETVAVTLRVLGRIVNVAVRDGALERVPFRELGTLVATVRRRSPSTKRDAWSVEEAEAILGAVQPGALGTLLHLAILTGARRGEILALRWQAVDLGARLVDWRASVTPRGFDGDGKLPAPKWGSGRVQPIPARLVPVLEAERLRRMASGSMSEWVCAAPRGGLWGESNASRSYRAFQASDAWPAIARRLTLHCARHTYCTIALRGGMVPAVLAAQVGASEPTIAKHYAHVMPTMAANAWDGSGTAVVQNGTRLESDT